MGMGQGRDSFSLIDPEFVRRHREEGYFGFMRVEINELFWLTVELNSSSSMSERCLRVQPGKIPVYDGGLGYAVDDPSWSGPRPRHPSLTAQYAKGTVGSIWGSSHEK